MHQHLQHIHLWFQHKSDSDGACPKNVPSHHSQIIVQTSINSCQIWMKDPQDHMEKLQAPCCSSFQKGNDHMAWNETISAATPLSNLQNVQKVENDIVIFNGNVLGHAWHTWCKKGTNGKRTSCSLLICHTKIFKSIDIRTMGLEIWITSFVYKHCRVLIDHKYVVHACIKGKARV